MKVGETYRSPGKVWRTKGLSLKLKGRLYSAFFHSVMFYNCEVWVIGKTEMKALQGKNVYLMWKVMNEKVTDEEERMSNQKMMDG